MAAIPFITHDGAAFKVNAAAEAKLMGLRGPVAVLAVCGRARQGKSWLLNQIVAKFTADASAPGTPGQTSGFQVASTHRPCTKGLWIWGNAIKKKTSSGLEYNLVLVDCEGIDAFDQTLDYSTQVFSLGLLLSSMMVYNQMGSIDESSVDKLSTVCEFAKRIKAKADTAGEADLRALSPNFLWLLRDHYLQLKGSGGEWVTPKDYMEEVLRAGGDIGKDQTRASIKELFPERDCAALIRPLSDESRLAAMDQLPVSALRPEFRQGLAKLLAMIEGSISPKMFRGSYLTGGALSQFARAFVDVINKGGVPTLSSTWQAVLASENRRAMDAAVEDYAARMAPATTPAAATGPNSVERLQAAHASALSAAVQKYRQQAMGSLAEQAESEAHLHAALASRFEPLLSARVAGATQYAQQLLNAKALKLAGLLGKDTLDADALHVQLSDMLVEYNVQASGPEKYKLAVEFMVNDVARPIGNAASRATTAATSARQRAEAADREVAELRRKLAVLEQASGAGMHDLNVARQELKAAQTEQAKAQGASAQAHANALRAEAMREGAAREVAQLKEQARRLQEQLSAAQGAVAAKAAEVAGQAQQLALAQRGEHDARAAVDAATRDVHGREGALQAELQRLRSELEGAKGRLAQMEGFAQREVMQANATKDAAFAVTKQEAERMLRERDAQIQALQMDKQVLQQQVASKQQQVDNLQRVQDVDMHEAVPTVPGAAGRPAKKKAKRTAPTITTPGAAAAAGGDQAGGSGQGAGPTPFSQEREVPMVRSNERKRGRGGREEEEVEEEEEEGAGAGPSTAAAVPPGLKLPEGVTSASKMKVADIIKWLVEEAHQEAAVTQLNNRKPKPLKKDWEALAQRVLNASAGR